MRGKSTHLTTAMEYEMAGSILGKAMNAVLVERMNEKNAERLLENQHADKSISVRRLYGSRHQDPLISYPFLAALCPCRPLAQVPNQHVHANHQHPCRKDECKPHAQANTHQQ